MKTKLSSLLFAGLLLSACLGAFAGPSPTYETLNLPEQFRQLREGDRIVLVCDQCKSVTEQTIASPIHALELCQVGADVTCPACKKTVRITTRGPSKYQSAEREIVYTNARGEECLFFARIPSHH